MYGLRWVGEWIVIAERKKLVSPISIRGNVILGNEFSGPQERLEIGQEINVTRTKPEIKDIIARGNQLLTH